METECTNRAESDFSSESTQLRRQSIDYDGKLEAGGRHRKNRMAADGFWSNQERARETVGHVKRAQRYSQAAR